MSIHMSQIPVKKVCIDGHALTENGTYEFTVDCGAVFFGAIYNSEGSLQSVDQFFYTDRFSRDDVEGAIKNDQLFSVDDRDFPIKAYLLSKTISGREWLRFHAVVPCAVNPDYFYNKFIGD
ncbi:hypothetical protein [Sporomusa acidovorans]|uniref:Uncharacterized protein n=1 Tax=Sporomusa acidovorans (strain ATCC 49682 / DSM 3132 / Mol) TaxID=1123286 RepID=A0ABZ3J3J2_SPOA4|nr:hypothetical protein [Sporomusa acidovorans]OZC20929.1 hypothetical protein SPACI_22920 [Sporomusa acidovorans DSM 3132]SDE61301.1 hypothetical protein SAMN04488499_101780 [Sporomusa acidovorans]